MLIFFFFPVAPPLSLLSTALDWQLGFSSCPFALVEAAKTNIIQEPENETGKWRKHSSRKSNRRRVKKAFFLVSFIVWIPSTWGISSFPSFPLHYGAGWLQKRSELWQVWVLTEWLCTASHFSGNGSESKRMFPFTSLFLNLVVLLLVLVSGQLLFQFSVLVFRLALIPKTLTKMTMTRH